LDEQTTLLDELNALMPANIVWKNDKHYRRLIVFKAKNYVMDDGKKVKVKGSALKGSKKEPALKEFTREVIDLLLKDRKEQVLFAYLRRCNEINALTDIKEWCFKITVTKKVLDPQATFQKKIRSAIGDTPVSEGDKVYMFFREDGSLCTRENFTGDFDKKVLLGKLRDTLDVFGNVFDVDLFPDLTLRRNAELLESINKNTVHTPYTDADVDKFINKNGELMDDLSATYPPLGVY
jgi:DNA polymerase elongation subunit (family B)